MNRVCAKSWTEPSSISFMVDTNALLNDRTSGKSADKPSLYRSAKALADVYSSPLDFNKSYCGCKKTQTPVPPLACPETCVLLAQWKCLQLRKILTLWSAPVFDSFSSLHNLSKYLLVHLARYCGNEGRIPRDWERVWAVSLRLWKSFYSILNICFIFMFYRWGRGPYGMWGLRCRGILYSPGEIRWDISRDWRGTSTPAALKICGRPFGMSQDTKAGAPPS